MQKRKTDIKRLTMAAMLCSLAYLAMVLIKIPVVLFLSYEPKDVIITLGGFIWGPMMALSVSLVVSFVEMITVSSTGYIGLVMNILSTVSFAVVASLIYKKKRTLSGAIIGLVVGSIATTVLMLLWNYLITPLYMNIARSVVAGMLLSVFLPFNLIKGALNASLAMLLYKPVVKAMRGARLLEGSQGKKNDIKVILIVVCVMVVSACVLGLLVMGGVI